MDILGTVVAFFSRSLSWLASRLCALERASADKLGRVLSHPPCRFGWREHAGDRPPHCRLSLRRRRPALSSRRNRGQHRRPVG